jgi:glycine oxidase
MHPEVIVVGGGLIGLASAWRSTLAGMKVVVVDDAPASGASSVAAGMLAPVTEVHYGEGSLLKLNLAASALYPGWVAELEEATGLPVGYRRSGTLMVARDQDENAALSETFRFQQSLGLESERLRSRECRELEPSLAPGIRGGIYVPGDHQVDPAALGAALGVACRALGVTFLDRKARALNHDGSSIRGIVLDNGEELPADRVVLAAGSWSGSIGGLDDHPLPVRPVKGQLVRLHADHENGLPVAHNIRGADVYLVPRTDGRLVIGATVEERGFDTSVTAGAVHDLLRDAYELVPEVGELTWAGAFAALRPGTPDNAPLIGPLAIEGVFAATGHYRNGVLLAPVTGNIVAEWLTTGAVPALAEAFSPARFTTPAVMPS